MHLELTLPAATVLVTAFLQFPTLMSSAVMTAVVFTVRPVFVPTAPAVMSAVVSAVLSTTITFL